MRPTEKILLVLIGRLGDLLVTTPFITALKNQRPELEIHLLVREYVRDLAELLPGVDRVFTLPSITRPAEALDFLGAYMGETYEAVVDLNSAYSRTSGLLCRFAPAKRKVTFEKPKWKMFYTETVPAPELKEHMTSRYVRLAEHFGAKAEPKMSIAPRPEHAAEAERVIKGLSLREGAFRLAIHPGNFKKFDHRWPEEKFIGLTRRIHEDSPETEIIYLVGPGEEGFIAPMLREVPFVKPAGPMGIGVTAEFLRRMDAFLVSATGTMHLAAALEVPMASLQSGYCGHVWKPVQGVNEVVVSPDWDSLRGISADEFFAAYKRLRARIGK